MFNSFIVSALKKRRFATYLVATFSFCLTGCAALQVHVFHTKVYLNKVPATSMAVSLPKGPGMAPGDKLPLVATFTTADGKVFVSEGAGHGKILWQDLNVSATVASVNNKGVLSLPSDPRVSEGKLPHVIITARAIPTSKLSWISPYATIAISLQSSPAAQGPTVLMAQMVLTVPAAQWAPLIRTIPRLVAMAQRGLTAQMEVTAETATMALRYWCG
jgi:hypothetical protein